MIKHIVMFKLKDHAEGAAKAENAQKIKALLEGLKGKIDGIRKLEVGINRNLTSAAYDVMLYTEFDNNTDLDAYQNHPEHLKAGEFISKVRLDRKVIDYEV